MIAIAENGNHKDYFSKLLSRAMRWLLANDRNTFLSGQSSPSGRLNIFQWSRKVCWMGHRSVCLCSDAKCMWKTSRGLGPSGWGKRVSKIQAARGLTDGFKQQVSSGVVLSIRKGHTLPSREQMIWARRPYTQQSWGDRKACWHNCKRNVMYSQNWLYVCMFNLSQPYTHVPHGEEHFQHVLIWGAEVELEIHKRKSFLLPFEKHSFIFWLVYVCLKCTLFLLTSPPLLWCCKFVVSQASAIFLLDGTASEQCCAWIECEGITCGFWVVKLEIPLTEVSVDAAFLVSLWWWLV